MRGTDGRSGRVGRAAIVRPRSHATDARSAARLPPCVDARRHPVRRRAVVSARRRSAGGGCSASRSTPSRTATLGRRILKDPAHPRPDRRPPHRRRAAAELGDRSGHACARSSTTTLRAADGRRRADRARSSATSTPGSSATRRAGRDHRRQLVALLGDERRGRLPPDHLDVPQSTTLDTARDGARLDRADRPASRRGAHPPRLRHPSPAPTLLRLGLFCIGAGVPQSLLGYVVPATCVPDARADPALSTSHAVAVVPIVARAPSAPSLSRRRSRC